MKTQISCPACEHSFDIEDVLAKDLEKQIGDRLQKEYATKLADFNEKKSAFEKQKENEDEIFSQKLKAALADKQKEAQKKVEEKYAAKIQSLEAENAAKTEENTKLLESEIQLLQLKNDLEDKEQNLERKARKLLLEGKSEYEELGKKKALEEFELERKQFIIDKQEQSKMINDLKRKVEQGSMQKQGEVLELALQDFLQNNFRFDRIEEVQKGANGADVIQNVYNDSLQNCGKIVFETKRTKTFDMKWADKLKHDQLTAKAEIAVLVTETLPKDIDKFDFRNGIWICSYQEVKTLVIALRQILIQSHLVKVANENRGDKMEILYQYFTSGEFTQKTKRILDIYESMFQQLESEKKVTKKLWAQREKQILTMKENLSIVSGDIHGIAGREIDIVEEYGELLLE